MNKRELENYISRELENLYLEDILEIYDLTPESVFVFLYQNGMIDDDILEGRAEIIE